MKRVVDHARTEHSVEARVQVAGFGVTAWSHEGSQALQRRRDAGCD
jgi:hypothetical protein